MTEFQLLRGGKKVGLIDITNKSVTIDNKELADVFSRANQNFTTTESSQEGMNANYLFMATLPTATMIEMLIRLEDFFHRIGYEIEEYPSRRRSPRIQIEALSEIGVGHTGGE